MAVVNIDKLDNGIAVVYFNSNKFCINGDFCFINQHNLDLIEETPEAWNITTRNRHKISQRKGKSKVINADQPDYVVARGSMYRKDYDDDFGVYYGTVSNDLNETTIKETNNPGLESIPIPDLGYGMNHSGISETSQHKVLDFRIQNVRISTDNNTFSLFLGFYHIDEGSRYAINIVCPINYSS